jgi:hypothetical protein
MRKPDLIVNHPADPNKVYLKRWWIIPRNKYFNIYLHNFLASDDPIYHDHPWWSIGILVKGNYYEHRPKDGIDERKYFRRFIPKFRGKNYRHWLELHNGPVWSIFLTGAVKKSWGFFCPDGHVNHKDMLIQEDESGNRGVRCP